MVRTAIFAAVIAGVLAATPAAAQQTDAQRMAILKREAPAVAIRPGALAVMAASCGLRSPQYEAWAEGQQTGAGIALIANLWGVSSDDAATDDAYTDARIWLAVQDREADGRASHPAPDDCERLIETPGLLAGIDRFVGWPGQ